jgi:XTP/dITP diphosphohydrolase
MKTIVVASNNNHKIEEIKNILKGLPYRVISMKEAGINVEVEETGTTFLENAYIKASEIHSLINNKEYLVMSDDSGIEVDALGGAPGVYSARYAGEHGNSEKNNEKLLKELQGKKQEERKARFVCAIVLVGISEKAIKVQGTVEGYVTEEIKGKDGFGYDPLFYVPEYNMTFAEMSSEDKNKISHRSKALNMLLEEIKNNDAI